jgi:hypothetical protein
MRMKKIALCSLLVLTTTSCERDTSVKLRGGNPPVFELSGSGRLHFMSILGHKKLRQDVGEKGVTVWGIEMSDPDPDRARWVEDIASVTYGKVPDGYKQIYPENNAPAPTLTEGVQYEYWVETWNANRARGYFCIKDGKPEYLGQ